MKSNAIFYFILVILMNYVLMSTDVDFKKNGKHTTESSNEYGWAIFDSSEFKKGDEIYFKVTADHFTNNLLYFYFYDEPADIIEHESNVANLKHVKYSGKHDNKKNKIKTSETAYFTVIKNDENLGSLKGNYLLLQVEATGKITFENTAENQGKVKTIVIVVIVVVVVIALAIGIFCYCRRRKAMMNMQGNNYNDNANVYNYNNKNYNNNNYNNPGQNNYGQQQQYPNNQNYNMNMNKHNIQNNAYSNNNNQNAGNYGYPNQQYNGVPQSSNRYP